MIVKYICGYILYQNKLLVRCLVDYSKCVFIRAGSTYKQTMRPLGMPNDGGTKWNFKTKKEKITALEFCTVIVSNNDCYLSLLVIKNYMTLRFCIISTILLIGTGIRVFVSSSIASASRAWAWCLLLYYVNKAKLPLLLCILGWSWIQVPE